MPQIYTVCKQFGRVVRINKNQPQDTNISIQFVQSPATDALKAKSFITVNGEELPLSWKRDHQSHHTNGQTVISTEITPSMLADAITAGQIALWQFEEYFTKSGDSLKSLDLWHIHFAHSDIVIEMMARHCPAIVELKCAIFEESTIAVIRPLIGQLKKLQISAKIANFQNLFDPSTEYQLQELRLSRVPLPKVTFPKLISLHLDHTTTAVQATVEAFFARNAHIRHVTIECKYRFGIDHIIKHLPALLELTCVEPGLNGIRLGDIYCLLVPNRLHTVRLRKSPNSPTDDPLLMPLLTGLFHSRTYLRCLELEGSYNLHRSMSSIRHSFQRLQKVRVDGLDGDCLERLATDVEHLEEITVHGANFEFYHIRNALSNAAKLRKATVHIVNGERGELFAINGKTFDDIATTRRNRGIDLAVDYDLKYMTLDDIPVAYVSIFV